MFPAETAAGPLSLRRIARAWWPLAASWLLMAAELPAISAVIARLAHPEINLAAYGGVVFPLALILETPILMLLAASTALSRDRVSYARLRRYMIWLSVAPTVLHAAVAYTPLYYVVVQRLIGAPPEVVEPARLGLMIMLPWTASIAYRRFNQGVLIRFERSQVVGLGTLVRFATLATVLTAGSLAGSIPGIVVGAGAVICGVVVEAVYVGWRTRPVVRGPLERAPQVEPALTFRAFGNFYLPLAMTALMQLGAQPLNSAFLSRMPQALESLALWPVLTGVLFVVESMGIAYNEVVVALLDQPGAVRALRRFTALLVTATTSLLLILAATPLSGLWFGRVAALSPALAGLARGALWLALPAPALIAMQSWFQGMLLYTRRTRGITEAVAIAGVVTLIVLASGVAMARFVGLYVGIAGLSAGFTAQTLWLWWRSRSAQRAIPVPQAVAAAQPAAAVGD